MSPWSIDTAPSVINRLRARLTFSRLAPAIDASSPWGTLILIRSPTVNMRGRNLNGSSRANL
jgi:hypothetical protein